MKQSLCNVCGVPEEEWRDGKCYACGRGRFCEMSDDMIVEQRVYSWLDKQHMLSGGSFVKGDVSVILQSWLRANRRVPKYVLSYFGLETR